MICQVRFSKATLGARSCFAEPHLTNLSAQNPTDMAMKSGMTQKLASKRWLCHTPLMPLNLVTRSHRKKQAPGAALCSLVRVGAQQMHRCLPCLTGQQPHGTRDAMQGSLSPRKYKGDR